MCNIKQKFNRSNSYMKTHIKRYHCYRQELFSKFHKYSFISKNNSY